MTSGYENNKTLLPYCLKVDQFLSDTPLLCFSDDSPSRTLILLINCFPPGLPGQAQASAGPSIEAKHSRSVPDKHRPRREQGIPAVIINITNA